MLGLGVGLPPKVAAPNGVAEEAVAVVVPPTAAEVPTVVLLGIELETSRSGVVR